MLARFRATGTPSLLVIQNRIATLEDSLAVSYIAKHKLTYLALMLQLSGKHSPVYTYL